MNRLFIWIVVFLLAAIQSEVRAEPGDQSNWMSALDGKKTLCEFSIPGSHDSGALHEPGGDLWRGTAQCQTLSIAQQLQSGVRFLDLRCVIRGNQFQIYHGSIDQMLSFDSVVSDCIGFLGAHKDETLLLSVKREHDGDDADSFERIFDSYIAKNPGSWLLKDTLPTLDEARGKIVLLRRFDARRLPKGMIAVPSTWRDNSSFVIHGATEIHVQDKYALDEVNDKWPLVEQLLHEAPTGKKEELFLNFTSGYFKKSLLNIPDIPKLAGAVNSKVSDFFDQATPGRYGVIVMDFADQARCQKIIATNNLK